jgi:hypothetical protein
MFFHERLSNKKPVKVAFVGYVQSVSLVPGILIRLPYRVPYQRCPLKKREEPDRVGSALFGIQGMPIRIGINFN